MKAQCIGALHKPPLLLLEPEEVQLALRVQKICGETNSPELFPLGAWRSRRVVLEAAIQGAYLCSGSEPVAAVW